MRKKTTYPVSIHRGPVLKIGNAGWLFPDASDAAKVIDLLRKSRPLSSCYGDEARWADYADSEHEINLDIYTGLITDRTNALRAKENFMAEYRATVPPEPAAEPANTTDP